MLADAGLNERITPCREQGCPGHYRASAGASMSTIPAVHSSPRGISHSLYTARGSPCVSASVQVLSTRKGTNGVSTIGVTPNFIFFDRGTFWVLPLTYFYIPKSARAYLFYTIYQNHYFCSGLISVDPTCPQPIYRVCSISRAPLNRQPATRAAPWTVGAPSRHRDTHIYALYSMHRATSAMLCLGGYTSAAVIHR